MAICAFGALLNLLFLKRRGNSAFILSAAFLVMGAILWMIKTHASQTLVTLAGILLAGLLIADIAIRARKQETPQ
ncbi:MAG TPA: hypothetical protein VHE55_13405 [Fimbriimonadaceae bacterium]|nr:hypothetical protein [Fimbriimonadaceae bacterium]